MYEIITLPNGVRIAHEKMSGVRSAAVGIWVGVGSRYEKRGEEGSAHFIEHMLFKGTAHSTAAELAGRMDAIGGQVNAFTSRDSTCFYARVLDSHLDEASDILCEMFFDSLFSESDVVNERGVVLEEIDMYRDTPDIVVEQLMGRIFPGALGKPVLGRPASLNGMTGASLRAFKEREYSPERIVVSVCGSFTEDNLARLCSRFSALAPSRPAACRKSAYTPAVVVKRKATEQNHFCLSFPGLPDGDADRFSWQVLSMALGGGMSSRLFQTVREKHGLCYSIGSFTAAYKETGMLAISTAVGRDSEEKALALIREEIEKFRQDGITDKELRTARELIKSSIILSLESSSSRMNRLGSGLLLLGKCLTADEIIERYDAVTTESVLALAREKLAPEMMGFSAVGRLAPAEDYLYFQEIVHQNHSRIYEFYEFKLIKNAFVALRADHFIGNLIWKGCSSPQPAQPLARLQAVSLSPTHMSPEMALTSCLTPAAQALPEAFRQAGVMEICDTADFIYISNISAAKNVIFSS